MKRFEDKAFCRYDLADLPPNTICIQPTTENIKRYDAQRESGEATLWGLGGNIPTIGARVQIKFNSLGTGVVESYFVEHGWLGLCVVLDKIPDWKRKQHQGTPHLEVALVFGIEVAIVSEP